MTGYIVEGLQCRWGDEEVTFRILRSTGKTTYIFIGDLLHGKIVGDESVIQECLHASDTLQNLLARCRDAGLTVISNEM